MTTWITAPGTWYQNRDQIRDICERNFGPEHTKCRNKATGRITDNHGNWELNSALKFRYQKDYAWFMLQASHLQDVAQKWPYYTRSTGPK